MVIVPGELWTEARSMSCGGGGGGGGVQPPARKGIGKHAGEAVVRGG